ncbi:hypothetical protein EKH55_4980 [Sinorhizobium alkalisoli]|nr:hypothetical protein EKH55_4980 [Sinorhizobium alkalisoli]
MSQFPSAGESPLGLGFPAIPGTRMGGGGYGREAFWLCGC